jgi:hypothetical protein
MVDIPSILTDAAERAFEQLGFLMPDFDPPADPAESAAVTRGMMVRFTGPAAGALVVRGDDGLLEGLAANMLGTDGAPSLELQLDALGEIANVICGNVLPEAEDPGAVFRLAPPVPAPLAGPDARVRGAVRLHLDAGVAEITLLEADA